MSAHRVTHGWCPSVQPIVADDGTLVILRAADRDPLVVQGPLGAAVEIELAAVPAGPAQLAEPSMISLALEQLAAEGAVKPNEELDHGIVDPRFERQARYVVQEGLSAVDVQAKLRDACVLIVGMGGVGGAVAEQLARVGAGRIVCVDADDVCTENLARQSLYVPVDCGVPKVVAAKQRLGAIAGEGIAIDAIHTRIESTEMLVEMIEQHRPTLFVLAADAPQLSIRKWAYAASVATGVPFISGGQALPYAFAGPFVMPGDEPCVHCVTGIDPECDPSMVEAMDRHSFAMPALGMADTLVAAVLATDIFHWIAGCGQPATLGRRITIDMRSFRSEGAELECSACGEDGLDGRTSAAA